jgi:putative ABC transport system permease protein
VRHRPWGGRDITEAETAAQALERLGSDVDLVLLDFKLPDGDGLDLLAEIKRRVPDTLVIMMTGYSSVEKRLLGVTHIQNVWVSVENGVPLDSLSAQIREVLRRRHGIDAGEEDDFLVRTLEEMASVLTSTTTTMTWLLATVAAVSLLVGGIGIMNIMLVSVSERTREIGLRLSVGARDLDVLLRFLVEAMVLSVAGGPSGS